MGYIGPIPAQVPLTSDDLADGIVTSAKIADSTIDTIDIADAAVTKVKTTGVGGEVSTLTDAYKNYNNINADTTITLVSTNNYFLAGDVTVADTFTWTIGGTGTLVII